MVDIILKGTWDGTTPDSRYPLPSTLLPDITFDHAFMTSLSSGMSSGATVNNASNNASYVNGSDLNLTISSTSQQLDALSCKWFLKDDLATQCFIGMHRTVLIFAAAFFFLYVVGIPLVGAIIICR